MELRVGGDHGLALPREITALLDEELLPGGLKPGRCRIDRRLRVGRVGDDADDQLLQRAPAGEQNLAFISEVTEEGPLGQPRPLGNLRHRGVLKPVLAIQCERCLREPAARIGFPSTHARIIVLLTVTDMKC